MGAEFTYFIDVSQIEFADKQNPNTTWLHAMPLQDKVQHPIYGEMDFSEDALKGYAASVTKRTLGTVDPVIDYDHQMYDGIAAGWVKGARVQAAKQPNDGLQLLVEWTDDAKKKIIAKEYKYFSPTFTTLWTDQHGKEHKNVIFGGGLTNRPYLKNLVPVNLSDLTFGGPAIPPPTEDDMDMKKLRESLGLPETTSDDDTWKAFGEKLAKLNDPVTPPNPTPPAPPAPTLQMSQELKELAKSNPLIRDMITGFEDKLRETADLTKQLREHEITSRMAELDRSSLVVTPTTKDLIHDVVVGMADPEVVAKFWQLMDHMMTSQAVVVEMGERARSNTRYSRDKNAGQQFNELVAEKVKAGMDYAAACERVAAENVELYDAYRDESFAFRA